MKLADYLARNGMSVGAFIIAIYEATGERVSQGTLEQMKKGANCRMTTAALIVKATGGEVSYEDLLTLPTDEETDPPSGG